MNFNNWTYDYLYFISPDRTIFLYHKDGFLHFRKGIPNEDNAPNFLSSWNILKNWIIWRKLHKQAKEADYLQDYLKWKMN